MILGMIGRVTRASTACMLVLLAACAAQIVALRPSTPLTITSASGAAQGVTRRIVLRVFGAERQRIDWRAFRALEENGSQGYRSDALLDSATLLVTRTGPLFSSNERATAIQR